MKRNEILGELSDKALRDYKRDAHTEIQGAKFGRGKGTPEGEKTIAKREKGMAAADKRLSARDDERRAASKPRPLPKVGGGPEDSYGKNRYMGDSVSEVAGAQKCWPGHRKVGTQPGTGKNAGKRVNDCEKIKEDDIEEAVKKGLYYNVNKRKAAGTSRDASSPKAPTAQAWKDAAKTAKKEGVAEVAGAQKCWPGHRKAGTQAGTGKNAGKRVNKCVKIGENLEEGSSDYVGDAIEGLRMAKPGLDKESFLDELYSYIDAEMGMEAAEKAFVDRDSYDDWYENYADMNENANMLKVAKDDDKQTILQNPSTGVQTQIDKSNPNAPSLTKDETTGKLKLAAPVKAGATELKPNIVGKDVEVATESAELTAMLRIAGLR